MRSTHIAGRGRSNSLRCVGLAIAWIALGSSALGASPDIAKAPLSTASPTEVKPNVMFTLDDSLSMNGAFMPDEMSSTGKYGYWSSQCNGVAYNPGITYPLPVNSTGTALAAGSLSVLDVNTGSLNDVRNISSSAPTIALGSITVTVSTTNNYGNGQTVTLYSDTTRSKWMVGSVTALTSTTLTVNVTATSGSGTLGSPRVGRGQSTPYYYDYIGLAGVKQPKLDWTYSTGGVNTTTTFYTECMRDISATPASSVFTKKYVSAETGVSPVDERQNFANWAQYYSTRMKMMKAGVSLAFKSIDSKYRVGFNTINSASVTGSGFLDIKDFGATHKADFYSALDDASPVSATPLRGALSKVGQYFAKKRSGQSYDPIQYSCQKNFHILSTDGYWNTFSETSSYKHLALNNTSEVGQQDDTAVRPMWDGAFATSTTTESWNTTSITTSLVETPQTIVSKSTSSITTTTPISGETRNRYVLPFRVSVVRNNDQITRCPSGTVGECTIEVDTTSNHGFETGDSVTLAGVSNGVYNGTYTITKIDNNTYTYKLPSRPANNEGTPRGTSSFSSGGCPAGQGMVAIQEQRKDESTVSTTSIKTTTTSSAMYREVTTTGTVTPKTITTVVVDGVPTVTGPSDGTVTPLSVPVATDTIILSESSVADPPVVTAGTNVIRDWTDVGPVTYSACTASVPIPNPTAATSFVGPATQSAPVVTLDPPPNPVITSGTAAAPVVTGPTETDSTHVTNTVVNATSGGPSNTLADVAMYYYKTDLRTAGLNNCTGAPVGSPIAVQNDVCANNVAPRGTEDVASWQHVTTFTLGLGANGTLKYDPNYLTQTSGDFFNLKQGGINWPVPVVASINAGPANIDDLWHAAVNGRGKYFSASDPTSLANSLSGALGEIEAKLGSASAAAASNLQPVLGDNKLFVAQYVTGRWTGDVVALEINPVSGAISKTPAWSAKTKLDARIVANVVPRDIRYFKKDAAPNNTGQLRSFTYADLDSMGLAGDFSNACSKWPASSCSTFLPADVATANSASNMVDWLRGVDNTVYRKRITHPSGGGSALGDIVGGAPIYVSKPPFNYTENGYVSWANARASRPGTVYVAANDGMLHAFAGGIGDTGEERWAFMPSEIMAKAYKLADPNYVHEYFVDGAPVLGDVYDPVAATWKTILVGGLGAGGRSYYALDVTDPLDPKALWEFSNPNLGLTFGNPIITKRKDGNWYVVFASGHNSNVLPGVGDGNGHLFVLNALTGALVLDVETFTSGTTKAGSVTTPSGLSKINVWVDSDIDNTAKRFYGGDLLGNVWRFSIDDWGLGLPNPAAMRLANLQVSGIAQPITTQVALAEVAQGVAKYPVVYVGTGKYLEASDLGNTAQQSVYALKDSMTGTGLADVRGGTTLVPQTLTETTDANGAIIRQVTKDPVDWTTKNGWYVDLLTPGERVNVDPQLIFNTLTVAANIPSDDACVIGGSSFLYRFDIGTGGSAYNGTNTVGTWLGNSMVVGLSFVQLQKDGGAAGSGDTITITVDNGGNTSTSRVPDPSSSSVATKRTSWREIVD